MRAGRKGRLTIAFKATYDRRTSFEFACEPWWGKKNSSGERLKAGKFRGSELQLKTYLKKKKKRTKTVTFSSYTHIPNFCPHNQPSKARETHKPSLFLRPFELNSHSPLPIQSKLPHPPPPKKKKFLKKK